MKFEAANFWSVECLLFGRECNKVIKNTIVAPSIFKSSLKSFGNTIAVLTNIKCQQKQTTITAYENILLWFCCVQSLRDFLVSFFVSRPRVAFKCDFSLWRSKFRHQFDAKRHWAKWFVHVARMCRSVASCHNRRWPIQNTAKSHLPPKFRSTFYVLKLNYDNNWHIDVNDVFSFYISRQTKLSSE